MNKYAGISCPVCGKKFTDNDDIVVCPDCGAPHHRDCYRDLGSCAFSSKHAPDFVWKNPAAPAVEPPPTGVPAGAPYSAPTPPNGQRPPDYSRNFSGQPGDMPLSPPPGSMPRTEDFLGVHLEDKIDGISIKDLAQFIGPNTYYYLLRFKAYASSGQGVIVNFSAVIFGFLYYFYRKMYKWGAMMLGLFLVCMLPTLIYTYRVFPDVITSMMTTLAGGPADTAALTAATAQYGGLSMMSSVGRWVYLAATFFSGMYANKLYFTHAKENISGLQKHFAGRPDQELSHGLAIRGRTNAFAVVGVVGALVLAYFGYSAFLMVVYQNLLF